jgi:hypothetical protein
VEEEEDLDLSASGDVTQSACAVVVESEEGRLGVGVSEEHAEVVAFVLSLDHDEGVHAINLLTTYA